MTRSNFIPAKVAFIAGVLFAVAAATWAQSGGYPSRPRFASVGVGVSAPAGTGTIAAATAVTVAGATLAADTEGTFNGSFTTACTTTPSQAFKWHKVGDVVTLRHSAAFTCTSDATAFAVDAATLPAGIRPAANTCVALIAGTDNAVNGPAAVRVQTDGGLNFTFGASGATTACSATNWTNSGTKGLPQFQITYMID